MLGIQEAIDQVLTYVKGVWIKKRYIIVSTWLICPIGWTFIATMPNIYGSSARLFVDTNSLLRPLLKGLAIYNNPDTQVSLVAKTLFSRSNLEKIAREADLDITVSTSAEMDQLIEKLRKNLKLSTTRQKDFYTISYSSESPELSQKIVQITLDEFVESSLGGTREKGSSAEGFIDRQLAVYEARLVEAEQRQADFQRSRMDRVPGETRSYYARLQNQKTALLQTESKLRELNSQLEVSRAQMAGEEPVFGLVGADSSSEQTTISTKFDARIANLESQLDGLLIRYTENHPEVKKTKSLLDALVEDRNEFVSNLSKTAKETGSYSQFGNINQNPVYQELKITVAQYENQIASLNVRAENIREKISGLEKIIDLVPSIEAESQALNRDYGIIKGKYNGLLASKEQAELSRRAEASTDDVQFRVIEPAKLPVKPAGPNRIIMYTVVLILGFGSGLAIAFIVSQLKPVVLSASQLKSAFGIPIFGTVTHFEAEKYTKIDRRRMIVFSTSSTVIVVLFSGLVWAEVVFGRVPFELLEKLL
jgi:polysaccharide chain length determinant protein (PEP-CTERM system associated)